MRLWPRSPGKKITAWILFSLMVQVGALYGMDRMLKTDDVPVVPEAGDLKKFTIKDDLTKAYQVALSPQGRYVAYLENNQLTIVNVEDGKVTYQTKPDGDSVLQYFQWLPDRNRILLVSATPQERRSNNGSTSTNTAYKIDGKEVPIQFLTGTNKNLTPAKRSPYVKLDIQLFDADGANNIGKELVDLPFATVVSDVAISTFSNVLYLKMKNEELKQEYIHLVDINYRSMPITSASEVGRLAISQEKGILYSQLNDSRTRFISVKRDKLSKTDLKSNDSFVLLGINNKDELYFGKTIKGTDDEKTKVDGVYLYTQGAMEKIIDLPSVPEELIEITPTGQILVSSQETESIVEVYSPTTPTPKTAKADGNDWQRVPAGSNLLGWIRSTSKGTEIALYRI